MSDAGASMNWVARNVGWNRLGIVLSLVIVAVAAYVLWGILKEIKPHEVVAAMRATPWYDLALAALFVACGYFTLTFYDWFALRTIGRTDVPYRTAALAGFTSYSIGHNVGASAVTGGAVRYRIYSVHGLSAVEVARLCFVAGLTFWLGNIAILGLGIALEPEAATQLNRVPAWINRTLALVALAGLAGWVAWVWSKPREIGRGAWSAPLPKGPLTLLQIGIGIADLGFCALAMWMLMPHHPHIDFIALTVIFVAATLLGFASHSPGGLGVFDAAMLVALPAFDKEEVLAALLLFRLLYYIVPFALSVVLLGLREVVLARRRDVRDAASAARPPASTP
jgi:glycosyltransferase 2 family protein